jgi:hypothetical protein
MARIISEAEGYEKIYEALTHISFTAFDYYSVKQNIVEYLKTYFPESFNDFIESSEFVALIEIFAYVTELMAYRFDVNAHENILEFAKRKDSVLRLAKMLSYKPTRNIPARGLVKIDSITTTEDIFDTDGTNLSGTKIQWNSSTDPRWKERFITIIERILNQPFGTTTEQDRTTINNIVFERYDLNVTTPQYSVIPIQVSYNNKSTTFEIVPCEFNGSNIQEVRPSLERQLNVLYASDGRGDQSLMTGFFMYIKNGTLHKLTKTFDGVIPNQVVVIEEPNINEFDVWVNNVDPVTGLIEDDGSNSFFKSGLWEPVETSLAQNIIFNTLPTRKKYEIETLEDDKIKIIFGDGKFSDIPSGTFDIWYRTSEGTDDVIPKNAILGKTISIDYVDSQGKKQTVTFEVSLVSALQNSSSSESIDHIRRVAPSVYSTQNRMVSGKDYSSYLMQDSSVLKLTAVNRTFVGDTNKRFRDNSGVYGDVQIYGDDLSLFIDRKNTTVEITDTFVTNEQLIDNYIEPLLATYHHYVRIKNEFPNALFRTTFTTAEKQQLLSLLNSLTGSYLVKIDYVYNGTDYQYVSSVITTEFDLEQESFLLIDRSVTTNKITVTHYGSVICAESINTNFLVINDDIDTIDFNTLERVSDNVTVLKANVSTVPNKLFEKPFVFKHLTNSRYEEGELVGLHNPKRMIVVPEDVTSDGFPDNVTLDGLKDSSFSIPSPSQRTVVELPFYFLPSDVEYVVHDNVTQNQPIWHTDGFYISSISTNSINIVGDVKKYFSEGTTAEVRNVADGANAGNVIIDKVYTVEVNSNVETVIEIDTSGVSSTLTSLVPTATEQYGVVVPLNRVTNKIIIDDVTSTDDIKIRVKTYSYFEKDKKGHYKLIENTERNIVDYVNVSRSITRLPGTPLYNFSWTHKVDRFEVVDPSTTNIVDLILITKSYYNAIVDWVKGVVDNKPTPPSQFELTNSYQTLLDSKMISDTVIPRSGKFKILFGKKAVPELQGTIVVVKSKNTNLTDNEIKTRIIKYIDEYFDINRWDFGQTFYYSNLDGWLQRKMGSDILSTRFEPLDGSDCYFVVQSNADELFLPDVTASDIVLVDSE